MCFPFIKYFLQPNWEQFNSQILSSLLYQLGVQLTEMIQKEALLELLLGALSCKFVVGDLLKKKKKAYIIFS